MRKILTPRFVTFRTDCYHCGCRFEYERDDIDYEDNVVCPCCGRELYHDATETGHKRLGEVTK